MDSETTISSESDVQYSTPHVYFFVPYNVDDDGDDDELGAILRLGEASDLEYDCTSSELAAYYPQQHISDAGDSDTAVGEAAGVSDSETLKGILLSCDGRILVKAGEKMYIETGAYNQAVNGNYELDATGSYTTAAAGTVSISSTGSDVKIASADSKDIHITAGETSSGSANGTIYESSQDHYKVIGGHQYEKSTAKDTYVTGVSNNFFFGATSTVQVDADFTLLAGGSCMVKPILNVVLTGIQFEVIGKLFELKGSATDIKESWFGVAGLSTKVNELEAEIYATDVTVSQTTVQARDNLVAVALLESKVRQLEAEMGGVRAAVRDMDVHV